MIRAIQKSLASVILAAVILFPLPQTGALDHERQTVEGLRGSLPVWFMAGAPLVEVVPMAEDFCLN